MNTRQHLIAAAFAAALTSPAWAQNTYAELGIGRSHASADCAGTSSCDRNGVAVRGILGYEFAPNWAVEVALASLGSFKATGSVPGAGTVQATAKVRGAGVGVAGTLPLNEAFSLTGRLGLASNKTSISGSAGSSLVKDGERKTALYAGLALNYALSKTTSVGLSVDRTEASYAGDKFAVVTVGAGARFRF